MKNKKNNAKKWYIIATRDINLEALFVTGFIVVLFIIWACLIEDKNLLFIPLLFLVVCFIAFIFLLFRYITEPKIAIQADCNGILFCYRNHKQIYINYKDIVDITNYCVYSRGGAAAKSGIVISTKCNRYRSISIKEPSNNILTQIKTLVDTNDKEKYLMSIEKNKN